MSTKTKEQCLTVYPWIFSRIPSLLCALWISHKFLIPSVSLLASLWQPNLACSLQHKKYLVIQEYLSRQRVLWHTSNILSQKTTLSRKYYILSQYTILLYFCNQPYKHRSAQTVRLNTIRNSNEFLNNRIPRADYFYCACSQKNAGTNVGPVFSASMRSKENRLWGQYWGDHTV